MYIIQQIGFSLLYTSGSILVAVMLGVWFSKSKVTLPRQTKFLFGCASTPFVVGNYLLVFTIIPFRLPNIIYYSLLYIAAGIYIYIQKEYILEFVERIQIPICIKRYIEVIGNIEVWLFLHIVLIQTCDEVTNKIGYISLFFVPYICYIWLKNRHKQKCKYSLFLAVVEYIVLFCIPILINKMGLYRGVKVSLFEMFLVGVCVLGTVLVKWKTKDINKGGTKEKAKNDTIIYALTVFYLSSIFCYRNAKMMIVLISIFTLGIVMIIEMVRSFRRNSYCEWLHKEIIILANGTILLLLYSILTQLTMPVYGADASEYLSNALEVVRTMKFESINSFAGDIEGRLVAIIHHPNYVLYLGFALLHSITGQMGFPYDFAARIAFNFNIIFFIIAILGLSSIFKGKYKKYFCIIFPFACYSMNVIFLQNSRDGYRMIPIVIFVGLLIGIKQEKEIIKDNYIAILFCAAFVMMGHPINAVQAVVIVIAYLCWCIFTRKINVNLLYLAICGGLGAVIGAAQILFAFMKTGRFTGDLINLNELLQNTHYYNNYMEYSIQRLRGCETFWERITVILSRDYGIIMLPGLIAMIYYIIRIIKKREFESNKFFIAIIVAVQTVTILDVFGWSGFSLTEWYVKNLRYSLQLYLFAGILLGIVVSELIGTRSNNKLLYTIICAIVALPFGVICLGWTKTDYYGRKQIIDNYAIVNEVIDSLDDDQEMMIDNYFCNYYLGNRATSFFTNDCRKIREAQNVKELEEAFRENNIGAVMIYQSFIDVYWRDTLLLEYLEDKSEVEYSMKNDEITVYKLKD